MSPDRSAAARLPVSLTDAPPSPPLAGSAARDLPGVAPDLSFLVSSEISAMPRSACDLVPDLVLFSVDFLTYLQIFYANFDAS